MGNKEPIIILAILFGIIILLIVPSIPFTEAQFYKQITDLNYSKVQEGDYNNMVLVFDGNKISVADANSFGGEVDGNFVPLISDVNSDYGFTYCADGNIVVGYLKGFSC